MLKKHISVLIAIFAVLMAFSGCVPSEIQEVSSIPEDAVWERDPNEHWISGESGEKTNVGKHEFDEESFCAVCKSFVEFWTDGGADICNYDEKYNLTRSTSYDHEGNVLFDYVMEYEYNEKGALSYSATYQNGMLYETYELTDNDVRQCFYNGDGSYSVEIGRTDPEEIDEKRSYDAEGNLVFESYTKNFLTEEGAVYFTEVTSYYHTSEIKQIFIYNANGDELSCRTYNFGGKLLSTYDYIYEYGEENLITYQKILLNGNLNTEIFYDVITENGTCYAQKNKQIVYYENGEKLVIEFDELENEKSFTNYDANGNIKE